MPSFSSNWRGFYGHNQIKSFLDNLLHSEIIPQSLIFSGPSGVGKDCAAIKFAENFLNYPLLLCGENPLNAESLADRGSLLLIYALPRGKNEEQDDHPLAKLSPKEINNIKEQQRNKLNNPYSELQIPNANQIKINSIREVVRVLSLNREKGERLVVVIFSADQMNDPAQNALLKILEEPPENTTFILTTSNISILKQTIVSRSWVINFGVLAEKDITGIVNEYFGLTESEFKEFLPLANGSVKHLLNIISHSSGDIRNLILDLLRNVLMGKINTSYKMIEGFCENDPERLILLLELISVWFRDIGRNKYENSELFYSDFLASIQKFRVRYPDLNVNRLHSRLEFYRKLLMNTNVNQTVIIFNLLFTLADIHFKYSDKLNESSQKGAFKY